MKSAMYFEETQALMKTFSQEDQVYFQDLWDYFNLAGFLYEEKALREQVYNLALDFSQAGEDGLTAKDYFGLDPKGMAGQIIENMPKESTRSVLKYGAIFSGIVIFYRLLSDFASQAVLVLKPLVYLTDIHFGTPNCWIIFYLLRRLIFAEEKAKKEIYVVFVLVLGFYFVSEIVGVRFLPAIAWLAVPSPWDALLMTGASGARHSLAMERRVWTSFHLSYHRLFSGWILTSLDLGTRSSESWYDSSSAHSDHRLWASYLLLVYDSCFEKNRTESDK